MMVRSRRAHRRKRDEEQLRMICELISLFQQTRIHKMRQVLVIVSQIDPVFLAVVDELDQTNRFHIQHCAVR